MECSIRNLFAGIALVVFMTVGIFISARPVSHFLDTKSRFQIRGQAKRPNINEFNISSFQVRHIAVHDPAKPNISHHRVVLDTPLSFDIEQDSLRIPLDVARLLINEYEHHADRFKPTKPPFPEVLPTDTFQESSAVIRSFPLVDGHMPPVSVEDFNYIIVPKSVCAGSAPKILGYVHTAPKNFEKRMNLRNSWAANTKLFPKELLQTIFVIGVTAGESQGLRQSIKTEAETYGDILYVNFTDSYVNLTYKAVVAMKFITTSCKGPQYILKTDDDTIVNIPALERDLKKYDSKSLNIACIVFRGMPVIRDPKGGLSKWYVDPKEYPVKENRDVYPTYCSGTGLAMTYGAFETLYSRVPHEPWVWVDDAYFTGVLAQNVPEMKFNKVNNVWGYPAILKKIDQGQDPKSFVFVIQLGQKSQYEEIWKRVNG